MENIELTDYLQDKCPYKACDHNDDGCCLCENITFLCELMDHIKQEAQGKNKVTNFVCTQLTTEELECPYCGSNLQKVVDSTEEFWGAPVARYATICPNRCT